MSEGWDVVETKNHGVHVVPLGDTVQHTLTERCVCRPTWGAVWSDEARTAGWLFTHSAADGRS